MHSQKIKIKEYTSASITGSSTRATPRALQDSTHVHADLDVNFLKLSVAMVKANVTRIQNIREQVYDTMLASLGLYGLLKYTCGSINLRDGFRKKYRDFSKSSRIGELAQAINYIFAQERLNFRFIVDFDTFLLWNSIKSTARKGTPDYIMFNDPNHYLSILESKGSSQKQPLTRTQLRSKLHGAMDTQCNSGVNYIKNKSHFSVSNSYASVVELAEYSESRDSQIHFADPEYEDFGNEHQDYSLTIRKYYSLWLLFIGVEDAIRLFETDDGFKFPTVLFDSLEVGGKKYYIQKSSYQGSFVNIPIKYGISSSIISLLEKSNYSDFHKLEDSNYSYENMEVFSDGTIAILEDQNLTNVYS